MVNLKFNQIREIYKFCQDLFSEPDPREVVESLDILSCDFEVDNVRFIRADMIDQILADELTSQLYLLGCFNADFIAEQTDWPIELIQAAQDGEAFYALGKVISETADMISFASSYAEADGYGHHFNRHDGEITAELNINSYSYFVFDNQ